MLHNVIECLHIIVIRFKEPYLVLYVSVGPFRYMLFIAHVTFHISVVHIVWVMHANSSYAMVNKISALGLYDSYITCLHIICIINNI